MQPREPATRPGTVHNNKLTVSFWGSVVDGNAGPFDINAFGARTLFPSATPVGTNNKAVIDLKGISKQATVNAVASYPAEPAGTNTVTVTR